jgi:hypothetical protein
MPDSAEMLAILQRRRDAVRLGGDGMLDVLASAIFLRDRPPGLPEDDDALRVLRALETGMFVIYARPFVGSRLAGGPLKLAPGLSPYLRETHEQILDFRRTAYAHTDATPVRSIIDVPEQKDEWLLHWLYSTPQGFDAVSVLAQAHLTAWLKDLEDLDSKIGELESQLDPVHTSA